MMYMKRLFWFVVFVQSVLYSQIKIPAASPFATISQHIGLGSITVEYSRPSLRGRDLFGELTRVGEVWRTGANMCTTLITDKSLFIGGHEIKPGKYSIYSIPGKKEWVFIFNKKISWGTEYEKSEDVIRIPVTTKYGVSSTEMLQFYFNDITLNTGILGFSWGTVRVELNISVNIHDEIMKQIDLVTAANKRTKNRDYYNAATYYMENNLSSEKAVRWATIFAEEIMPKKYWAKGLLARALAYDKQYEKAIVLAKKVIDLAKEHGNNDYVTSYGNYIKDWDKKIPLN